MAGKAYEYGRSGVVAVAPPQSNPTVEPELAALLPASVNIVVTRLRGHPTDGRQRFLDYLDNLPASIEAFGELRPDALGFACTSTGYLLGIAEEERRLAALSQQVGYPVVSSSQAVRQALAALGATSIDLVSPYPDWLTELSIAYWESAGLKVVSTASVLREGVDLLNIYRLRTEDILPVAASLSGTADAVLLAGTGMPSLRAMPQLAKRFGRAVVSANLCLAWALRDRLGLAADGRPRTEEALFSWRARAVALLG